MTDHPEINTGLNNNVMAQQQNDNRVTASDFVDDIEDFHKVMVENPYQFQQKSLKSDIFDSDCQLQSQHDCVRTPRSFHWEYEFPLPQPLNLQPFIFTPPQIQDQEPPVIVNGEQTSPLQVRNNKRYSNLPWQTWMVIQSLGQNIEYQGCIDYGQRVDFVFVSKVQKVFYLILKHIILKITGLKRNKRFLRMVFNDVNHRLNVAIRSERDNSEEHEFYFSLLEEYGEEVMNAVKQELRNAVQRVMEKQVLKNFAYTRNLSTQQKQVTLFKYLCQIRRQLRNGHITGSVEGDQVEEALDSEIDE